MRIFPLILACLLFSSVTQAQTLRITTDNFLEELWIGGTEVQPLGPNSDEWPDFDDYLFSLPAGPHVIAFRVLDDGDEIAGAMAVVFGPDNESIWAITGDSVVRTVDSDPGAGWAANDFDDSAWPLARNCDERDPWGDALSWGRVLGAEMVWGPDSCDEEELGNRRWFRMEFLVPCVTDTDCAGNRVCVGDVPTERTCVCDAGFFGEACAPCTCVNGTCNDTESGDGTCLPGTCTTSWTGPNCDICPAGFFDNGEGGCVPCADVANCDGNVTCTTADDSVCDDCADGFFGPTCTACTAVDNCDGNVTCTTPDDSVCDDCADGFFGPTCTACTAVDNCDGNVTCTTADDSVCDDDDCADGFFGPTCTACTAVDNCDGNVTCTTPDDSVCDDCADGFFGPTCAACTPVDNCAGNVTCTTADDSTCSECAAGFFEEEDGTCTACTPVENCDGGLSCSNADNSVCGDCAEGFEGDQCQDCGSGRFGPACELCTCENGLCDEGIEGTGICEVCDTGWTGDDCDECATGYTGLFCDECDTHFEESSGVCVAAPYCSDPERNECDEVAACAFDAGTQRGYTCTCPVSYVDVNEDGTLCEPAIRIASPVDGTRINDPQPEISGTGTPGATVVVTINGAEAGTVEVDSEGNWSLDPDEELGLGPNTIAATSTLDDVETQDTINVFLNPGAPWILIDAPALGEVLRTSPDEINGRSEQGAEVEVYLNGELIGTVEADEQGNWSLALEEALDDGTYEVEARADRGDGGPLGTASSGFIVDSAAEVRILSPLDGARVRTGQPTVSGTAEPDAEVEIFVDGDSVGTVDADENGNWSWTPEQPLADGEVSVTATSGDSSDTVGFTVDTEATDVEITEPADNALLADPRPTVRGTAAPGATVIILVDGEQAAAVAADENGQWSWTPESRLPEGEVVITAVDEASESEDAVSVVIDTIPPALEIDTPQAGDELVGEAIVVSGTSEPGARIDVYVDGELVGSAEVDENGDWSVALDEALPPGETEIVVVATDGAGNASRDSVLVEVIEPEPTEPPTTEPPTTEPPTTEPPTTEPPTTEPPTTEPPTSTEPPTTEEPATSEPSEDEPTAGELFGGGVSCAAAQGGRAPFAGALLLLLGVLWMRRQAH